MTKSTPPPSNSPAAPPELTPEIYSRIRSQIVRQLQRAGAKEEEIEDLVQETFSEAHRNREKFEGRSGFDTWAVGIAKKVWLHHLRDRHAKKREAEEIAFESDEQVVVQLNSQEPNPEAQTAEREVLEQVEKEIAEMPKILSEPLLLQAEGFSYKEITVLLKIPQKLVTSRVHQARDQLRKLFPERSGARRQVQHGS